MALILKLISAPILKSMCGLNVVSNLAFCDVLVGVMSPLFSAVTPCSPSEVGGNPSTDDYREHPCWIWIYHPAPGS